MTIAPDRVAASRHASLDIRRLVRPPVLIFNLNSGRKLGMSTNAGGAEESQDALGSAGVAFDPWPTERAGDATDLARKAVAEGRTLVIAAGGDGTAGEVAQALAGTDVVLGIMPLGSVMNVARTLCIPRDLHEAARVIAGGQLLAMDLGRVDDGLLDVVIFHGASVPRMLFHLLAVAGGRRLSIPPDARMLRGRSIRIAGRRGRRTLPVHADGTAIGATPITFDVVPSALRVLVGAAEEGAACA